MIKKMSELGPVHLVPPIPRYLSSPCCNALGHCPNRTNPNFDLEIVGDLTRIREFLKKKVTELGLKNVRILDGIAGVTGYRPGEDRPGNREAIPLLKQVTARDGVHLTEQGLKNLAGYLVNYVYKKTPDTRASTVPGSRTFYWRGFLSCRGSLLRPKQTHASSGPPSRGAYRGQPRPSPYGRGRSGRR